MLLVDFEKEMRDQIVRLKKQWMVSIVENKFHETHRIREIMDCLENGLDKLMWFQATKPKMEEVTNEYSNRRGETGSSEHITDSIRYAEYGRLGSTTPTTEIN